MDPQHRHFLECAWEALESAGCVPERFDGAIGVFAGCGMNTYLLNNLLTNAKLVEQVGVVPAPPHRQRQGLPHRRRVVPARPARAVGQRADGLLDVARRHPPRRAEPARARVRPRARRRRRRSRSPTGAATSTSEGEILAPDGRCRAFDAESAGTVLTQRRRRRGPAPPRRRDRRRRPDPRRDQGHGGQQRRRAARSASSPRASTATPTSSARRSPSPAVAPATSSSSRPTAPAPPSATRSRSPPLTEAFRASTAGPRLLPARRRPSRTSATSTPPPAWPA